MHLKPNTVHAAFEWKRSKRIPSLNVTIEEYHHKVTGALHYHLLSDNSENVFLVGLRTVPMDSKGVAHILEHTALCGSKRYPVRDPFFMMIRRSLNTFMNAFTSSDWTAYPFASQNKKDFNNLLDVYLDAVFFSNLNKLDFLQEGHRLEFETLDDPNSDLVYKGVVYNEMKGAMGQPVSMLWQTLTKYLFPSTTYHYNSGGDPAEIPKLSYPELVSFYKTHYHPSNAIFMTFGDIPAIEHHEKIETLALSKFTQLNTTISVPNESRYIAPINIEEHYPLDDDELSGDKTHIILGWLLNESANLESQLKLQLLSGVLLDNSASPLRLALETTDLGSSPSPLCGLSDSNREMTFMCGLEGSTPKNAEKLEKLVFDVLHEIAEKGITQEHIDAVLHQLELEQREVNGGSYPYGLQVILDCLPSAIHRGDPFSILDIDSTLEKLRNEAKNPQFVKDLVSSLLIENLHRVRLTMIPDTEYNQRQEAAEKEALAKTKRQLNEENKRAIIEQSQQLAKRQLQKDDEEILPKVGIEDVPDAMHIASMKNINIGKYPASYFDTATNGLVYQQLVVDLPFLDDTLSAALPHYTSCITELGCGKRDYLQMQALQSSISGGIGAFTTLRSNISDVQKFSGHLFLSSKALKRNQNALVDLTYETLQNVRFDELDRIRELMAQTRAYREQSVMGNGHGLAMSAASAGLSPVAALKHKLNGLLGIHTLKTLDETLNATKNIEELADNFRQIHSRVLASPLQFVAIAEAEQYERFISDIDEYWSNIAVSSQAFKPFEHSHVQHQVKQCWVTSTPVNFCSKAYATVPIEHEDAPALAVLAGFLRNGHLHRSIREQGGAYGGGASYVSDIAAFRFYSYRDPRLADTLNDFDQSIEWLLAEKHEWRQLEEAILGIISGIDKPSSPSGEAKDAFVNRLYGRSPEQRQLYRSRILKVTLDDLKRVGAAYLKPELASTAVITNSSGTDYADKNGFEIIQL